MMLQRARPTVAILGPSDADPDLRGIAEQFALEFSMRGFHMLHGGFDAGIMKVVHDIGTSVSTPEDPQVTALITNGILAGNRAVEDHFINVGGFASYTGRIPMPSDEDVSLTIRLMWLTTMPDAIVVLPETLDESGKSRPSHGTRIEICHALMNHAVLKRGRLVRLLIDDYSYRPLAEVLLQAVPAAQQRATTFVKFREMNQGHVSDLCGEIKTWIREHSRT